MKLFNLIIITFVTFFSLSFADTNGIWTYPEDIRAGVFGADEGLTGSDSFTFNNVVYFNANIISNSTIQSDVDIIGNRFIDIQNPTFFLNPSGVSNIHRIVAERYFSPSTNTLFLNPAGLSRISELEVQGNINLGGTLLSGEVPWSRLSGHPSILAGAGLVGGGVLNQDRTLSLNSTILDGSHYDSRFVNRAGDTMTGNLNMQSNNIWNVGWIGIVGSGITIDGGNLNLGGIGNITNVQSISSSGEVRLLLGTGNGLAFKEYEFSPGILGPSLQTSGDRTLSIRPYGAGPTTINPSGPGNVGIGIMDPQSKLHVGGEVEIEGNLNMNNNRITNVATPINHDDVATKEFVEDAVNTNSANCQLETMELGWRCTGGVATYSDCPSGWMFTGYKLRTNHNCGLTSGRYNYNTVCARVICS
ncbi:MAG: hypothetical protein LAT82_05035 [Nanoarchaeota archaeon]|nr:hypothetical protein [Nanoarchaeota archaeon]